MDASACVVSTWERHKMPNVFGGSKGTQYFQKRKSILRDVKSGKISPHAYLYYGFLCNQMNETGQVELEYTNDGVSKEINVRHHATLSNAREELGRHGYIDVRSGPSRGFIHALLDDLGTCAFPSRAVRLCVCE
jgi:hypothetical protein